jgi:sn-glycerol 3-phosphate transport system substrate-binding protein
MNRGPNATRSMEENRGIAEFYAWLARPEVVRKWHVDTGFLPVRQSVFRALEGEGFYRQNPGADIPIEQLLRGGGQMTDASRGIRLGGFVEIRTIIQEELERAFQGQQTPEQALTNAQTRGNVVLRNFERQNRQ